MENNAFLCSFLLGFLLTASVMKIECEKIEPNCDFSYVDNKFLGNIYQCKLNLSKNPGNETIEKVKGHHEKPNNDSNVQFLDFTPFECHQFPKGFGKIFPKLLGIRGVQISLKKLDFDDLKVFKHLKYLDLHNNHLKSLKSDLFSGNVELQYVDLSKNKLSYVGANIFHSLLKLSYVNLSHNKLPKNIAQKEENAKEGIEALKQNLAKLFQDEPEVYYAKKRELCKPLTSILETKNDLCQPQASYLFVSSPSTALFVYLIIDLVVAIVYLTRKILSLTNSNLLISHILFK